MIPHIAGEPLNETPWEHGDFLEILSYCDGPRVVLQKDALGKLYIGWWNDEDDERERWVYVGVSPSRLRMILDGSVPSREAIENPEDGYVIVCDADFGGEGAVRATAANPASVPPSSLPARGARLATAVAGDFVEKPTTIKRRLEERQRGQTMFTTNPITLNTLLQRVHDGDIQLPDFQRGWVWDDYRIRGLLASVSRGFPVGAVMTLDAGSEIKFRTRPIEGVTAGEVKPSVFLLDGQQRLTSLYQSMTHDGPVNTQDNRNRRIRRWYYVDMLKAMNPAVDREDAIISVPENRKITGSFGRRVVLDLTKTEFEYENHMMPTERLLDSMNWIFAYNLHWNNHEAGHPSGDLARFLNGFNDEILKTFAGYQLPVINLTRDTPKEAVCTVFEKVNTGGVVLTVFELLTASLAADNFSLRDDWLARRQRLSNYSGTLQGVSSDQFLQAVALLSTQERRRQAIRGGAEQRQAPGIGCRRRDILDLTLDEYQEWADKVEAGFKSAAKFLLGQFVFRRRDVPYATQIVPLAALYVELGNELNTANAKSKLERWYWSGVFGESYSGAIETQFSLDLDQVAKFVREGIEPDLVSGANFFPARLLSLRTRNSAAYKGLYALQMKSGAADWLSGERLTTATATSSSIDIHHIFPRAWCNQASPNIPPRLYNSVINKTPIDAATNRIIGGRSPSTYLPRLEGKGVAPETLESILKAHWINPSLLRSDDFAKCFIERGEAMLELIGEAMGKPVQGGRQAFANALTSAGFQDEYGDEEQEYDQVGDIANMDAAAG